MRKKLLQFSILFISIILLAACGSKAELSDYIELDFSGYDTIGTATYTVDQDQLVKDVFGINDEDWWELGSEEYEEINKLLSSYTIDLTENSGLSNGDEVVVRFQVNDDVKKRLKAKEEVTYEVTGLEELTDLTDEEIEKNVIVNFNGASGRGSTQIDTTFSGELYHLSFETDQDGEIKNGDSVTFTLTEESRESLAALGYGLAGSGEVTFEAYGLDVVPESASDIENLEDIERMIEEGINRRYQDSSWGSYSYEIIEGKTYYRQFEDDSDGWNNSSNNGTLITLYTIEEFDRNGDLDDTFTVIYGYSNIILDDNGNTNVTRINEYRDTYDNTYSLISVEKLMEGYGFELVEVDSETD